MNIIAVFNRDGGTFRTTDMAAYEAKAIEIFEGAGHRIECRVVAGNQVADALETAASRPDVDCIVAGGGDGTISAAAKTCLEKRKGAGCCPCRHNEPVRAIAAAPAGCMGCPANTGCRREQKCRYSISKWNELCASVFSRLRPRMVRLRDAMEFGSRLGKLRATVRAAVTTMARPGFDQFIRPVLNRKNPSCDNGETNYPAADFKPFSIVHFARPVDYSGSTMKRLLTQVRLSNTPLY